LNKLMVQLILVLDNLRSAHNVGAILRTCDAVGIKEVFACGITPYPAVPDDDRDPVVKRRNHLAIAKTALGAEVSIKVEHFSDSISAIAHCLAEGRTIYGLEQAPRSANVMTFKPTFPAALIVGSEVDGLAPDVLAACDRVLEIPQRGRKESLNVAVATGIALYQLLQ
jgi:23S rRNA (guanosine2251-2'-O)-methyltransferase